eukprot:CAMPEP_0176156322 /NCGR_PEP_ID=MMETSP0120_2-20121206/79904_1 /TAXON_ID=160619 /ORGANISM="Kryptoperidinium foliaceum, Strain CCMP 1326" /LENGTH=56 /DNA_ID=CAMNT_0017493541 /DNA_START=45 /DNA_END=211 /DNA_ORIENTATION=+
MNDLRLETKPYSDDPEEEVFHDEDLSSPRAAVELSLRPVPEGKRPISKVWWAIGLV